jgi:PEP-CTERM motif
MKVVVPALAAAFIATVGAGSAAQAAVIDFTFVAIGGSVADSTGLALQDTTFLNLDGAGITVSGTKPGDASGLAVLNTITISPTDIIFGAISAADPVVKMWTATTGPHKGDVFTETLTAVSSIDRSSANAVTVDLTGTVSDSDHVFTGQKVSMILDATQSGGGGNVISVSGSNSSAVPEPSTWVMMALGFVGLGYAAVRRSAKDKAALAI